MAQCAQDDTVRIPLTRGGKIVAYATIDADDCRLMDWRWLLNPGGYAVRTRKHPKSRKNYVVLMAREVLGLKRGDPLRADHINHDKLDNRRANLRAVTESQNQQNRQGACRDSRTGVRNVTVLRGKYVAVTYGNGGYRYGGMHTTLESAAKAAAELRARAGYIDHTHAGATA